MTAGLRLSGSVQRQMAQAGKKRSVLPQAVQSSRLLLCCLAFARSSSPQSPGWLVTKSVLRGQPVGSGGEGGRVPNLAIPSPPVPLARTSSTWLSLTSRAWKVQSSMWMAMCPAKI